jgi:hypothetical protein
VPTAVQGYCNAFELPRSELDNLRPSNGMNGVNFTFVGYEDMDGMWVLFVLVPRKQTPAHQQTHIITPKSCMHEAFNWS